MHLDQTRNVLVVLDDEDATRGAVSFICMTLRLCYEDDPETGM
jgi:hypothetical protein